MWDTVKSLGYLYTRRHFFDARLGDHVRHACHALAAICEEDYRITSTQWPEGIRVENPLA